MLANAGINISGGSLAYNVGDCRKVLDAVLDNLRENK